jgi:N6-adenosine-specific RNA methylase IME4
MASINLVRYDAARTALAKAVRVDEVKDIRDKAVAMQAYAKQAKDRELIGYATEIRMRAERRAGELLREMADNGERAVRKNMKSQRTTSKLADIGVTKSQSSRWQKLADKSEKDFEAVVETAKSKSVASTEKVSTTADKKAARTVREKELGKKQKSLPDQKFGVVLADPEWKFKVYSEDGMDRAAENHYPTSVTDAICARPVQDIAADDCILFLWATAPMLPDALRVMAAWGFEYKSHFIWNKDRIGTGYWNRNKHELMLVGTRGNIPAPAMGTQLNSVIDAPVGRHSAKPEAFYALIEKYFPTLPKIELNRRGPARAGWDAWGNEVEVAA